MINYIAHWDRILIQSRVEIIVNELNNYEFRSICPIVDKSSKKIIIQKIKLENIKRKYFDFNCNI